MFFPKTRWKKILIIVFAVILLLALIVGRLSLFPPKRTVNECLAAAAEATSSAKTLPIISKDKLKEFDGVRNPKTYLAFNCLVYDVTAGKDQYYGDGKTYHYLVGRDATAQLNIFGGDIIKQKYPVVGILGD